MEIDVVDIDGGSRDQDIGNFKFEYLVPLRPANPRNVTLRTRERRWYSDMTIEFEAVFWLH